MNLQIDYEDRNGLLSKKNIKLTKIAFLKHSAISGQGFAPSPNKLLRTLGLFFHYSYYLKNKDFNNNHFSLPPVELSDPTEQGQFSNIVGKAIADFLSKQIDESIFTVNYEAAMRILKMPLNVSRPDLIAFSKNSIFAIEAKGYSGGCRNMKAHKKQSMTGGIPVNFTIASVAYNIYKNIHCKYIDPYNDDIPYNFELLKKLSKIYYSGLEKFIHSFKNTQVRLNGSDFYEVNLYEPRNYEFNSIFKQQMEYYKPKLILPGQIEEFSKKGINRDAEPFNLDYLKYENIFVDRDRVGIKIMNI